MVGKSIQKFLVLGALCGIVSCGSGSDDDNFQSPEVTNMYFQDETIVAGEGTVLAVEFTYDRGNVFDDKDHVIVVVRLPNGIIYRDGTAEIDEASSGDNGVSPETTLCADGTSFLRFDLDRNDLKDAENPDGDADARVTLTIDALEALGTVVIESRADQNSAPFGCVGTFLAEDREVLNVL